MLAALVLMSCSRTGRVDPEGGLYGFVPELGTSNKTFSFVVWGDPQVGYFEEGTRWDSREAYNKNTTVRDRLVEAVSLTNQLSPDFVLTAGDNVHWAGQWPHYRVFLDTVRPLQAPLYLVMGNHDWGRITALEPDNPYGDLEFGNFLKAQEELNLPRVGWYSFDAGDWHFVMWSQPGTGSTNIDRWMEDYPELLEWLERDLYVNKDRPTIFVAHHPIMPVGRRQFNAYGLNAHNRARLMSIIMRGNVKLAFFGHVHNSVASIPLLSWNYRGTSFIVLPNAANTARLHDYQESYQSSWGVAEVKIDGQEVEAITFNTLAGETVSIEPSSFEEYNDDVYGYLRPDAQLPVNRTISNGSFEEELQGSWFINHLLPYRTPPVQERSVRSDPAGNQHLYLRVAVDPSESTADRVIYSEVRQAFVNPSPNSWQQLELRYLLDNNGFYSSTYTNAYLVLSGYREGEASKPLFSLNYSLGERNRHENPPLGKAEREEAEDPTIWLQRPPEVDEWATLTINPRADYEAYLGNDWNNHSPDFYVLRIGVSTGYRNAFHPLPEGLVDIRASFDDITVRDRQEPTGISSGFVPAFQ